MMQSVGCSSLLGRNFLFTWFRRFLEDGRLQKRVKSLALWELESKRKPFAKGLLNL